MRFHRHQSALVLASVLTVGSFVGATAYTQHRLMKLDALSSTIETNAAPSLEYLGRAGARLERVRALMREAIDRPDSTSEALDRARTELNEVKDDIERYLSLTPLPGERELWDSMRRNLDEAARMADAVIRAAAAGDRTSAARVFRTQAVPALDRAASTALNTLQFDARASERLARDIRDVRRTTTTEIAILDLLAIGVALVSAAIAVRSSREHDRLLQMHHALLEERITDLDRFAGRVAHDILSPLNAVGVALALASRSTDSHTQDYLNRAQRSVQRVKELVDALLRFARAGAEVDRDSRCPVDVVLANVVADCAESAREKGIEVGAESGERIEVASSTGVLTSVIQNLVSNAIRYMGDRPTKRVTVRARTDDDRVRIEVADTGPGIDPELQARMFEPFVRGNTDTAGMGLGLATVRRLVEAHHGSIEVESTGNGTVFRIVLPMAAGSTADAVASETHSAAQRT